MDASKLIRALLLTLLTSWASVGQATILFVVPSFAPPVMSMVNQTHQLLTHDVDVRLLNDATNLDENEYQAVVLVGAQVLEQWQSINLPTVAVLVSRQQVQASKVRIDSAIYAEPSLHQQIVLAESILGPNKKIGVLVQQQADIKLHGLDQYELDFHPLVVEAVSDYSSLNATLRVLLAKSEVLVGVYDKELYSTDNIKNILITAYRNNQALIGPTAAYLRAGAIASVQSQPEDIAKRLSEIVRQGLSTQHWPQADYNPYVSVVINQQVARSLNLQLGEAKQLAQRVMDEQTAYFKDRELKP